MPKNNWGDLSSIDYRSLPLLEREEFLREATRRAHAARTEQIAAIVSAALRLVRGLVAPPHATKGRPPRDDPRPDTDPGLEPQVQSQ